MTGDLSFFIVDVFAESKYSGNQLAVILDTIGLSDKSMQDIAREMHFSETTFIDRVRPQPHHHRVRIFTPEHEVPFAGHPVLGTAFVLMQRVLREPTLEITLSLPAGEIPVTVSGEGKRSLLWMHQLPPRFGNRHTHESAAKALSLPVHAVDTDYPVEEVSTGLPFIIIPLMSRDAVRSARTNHDAYLSLTAGTDAQGLFLFCREPVSPENTIHARMFADDLGIAEDPATGSATGGLAAYLLKHQYFPHFPEVIRVEQGYEINRASLLSARASFEGKEIQVHVGGSVFLIAEGTLFHQ